MRLLVAALALTVLAGAPALAAEPPSGPWTVAGAQPGTAATPQLSAAQLEALKRQLQAAPNTPGRAAMMQKLLKLALAMKSKQPVATQDLLALVAYLREANGDKASDPAFGAALRQLESGIMRIQGGGNEDLEELKRQFDSGDEQPDLEELKKEFDGY